MKRWLRITFLAAVCASWFGCSNEVGIRRATLEERRDYSAAQLFEGELSGDTVNLLCNYSLNDLLESDPERLIAELSKLFFREPRVEFLTAMADVSQYTGLAQLSRNRENAMRYFLGAAIFTTAYFNLSETRSSGYDPTGVRMILIYNEAVSELFEYLSSRQLLDKSGYELFCVLGVKVRFEAPRYDLPVSREQIREMLLCADYRPENLTHASRHFGIGAPLIIGINTPQDGSVSFARNQTIPGTFAVTFRVDNIRLLEDFTARVNFIHPGRRSALDMGYRSLPLEQDLTTPLAYMVKDPPLWNFFEYTRQPGASQEMQGLYRFGPPDDDRIPVVLVHGLLSDTRTWLQMINTLQSDDDIARAYQFWGFSYSSGNPIVYSAWMLRQALLKERARMVAEKRSTDKFDRMVIVGHSMGGLVTRMVVSGSGDAIAQTVGRERLKQAMRRFSAEERKKIEEIVNFEPLPFVRRVVFIATPHRGSELAHTWIARFGASLIDIPADMIRYSRVLLEAMLGDDFDAKTGLYITGVNNLDPESITLKMLNRLTFADGITIHSIIGNTEGGGIPGGSDGVVPYSSSHLDNAVSELVIKSGHSAQQAPLAIQEVRRILVEHLKQFPDSKLTPPLLLHFAEQGRADAR